MTTSRFSSLALAAGLLVFTAGCNNSSSKPAATTTPATNATEADSGAGPTILSSPNEPGHSWTEQQILTCTVSQCWQMADKNEDSFFDIVQQLAVISAKDRGLTLPEDEAAGKKTGEYIKAQAKADHQQLLFAIVDAAVRKVGVPETTTTTTASK